MAKISVVVPVYNAESVLRKSVESLVYGDERDLEVILCEDHGKDNSWTLCQALSQEFPNVIALRNDRNRGVSHTRNQCLQAATGEYILFVDSDDWVSGSYARSLIATAQQYPQALALCGFCFHDDVGGYKRDYLWSRDDSDVLLVGSEKFFDLVDKVLLQCLWNKVFVRSIIEKHRIRFDVTQSMGEDFQFVLDYMEAAGIKQCAVLNKPLYHYIRWNNTSLMSKFGLTQSKQEFARAEQLYRIVGEKATPLRDQMILNTKNNYVYHIVRNRGLTKEEKLSAVEAVMGDGAGRKHYKAQRKLRRKESMVGLAAKAKGILPRLKGRRSRKVMQKKLAELKTKLQVQDVTLISQNCIAGVLYHDAGCSFLSPTVNTFIKEPDFVKFVLNLRHYLECELELRWGEEYPIGRLDDIEIQFMHYGTCEEARLSWERRKARINYDKIFVLSTDRDGFDHGVYQLWKTIPYPKVVFTAHREFTEDAIFYPEFETDGQVGDLISKRDFYRDGILIGKLNSL